LVVLDELRSPVLYRDPSAWARSIQRLEDDWFAPLLDALKKRRLESATLFTDIGTSFRITSRAARRWWRFKKPFSIYQ
jgi:hypothetical protein